MTGASDDISLDIGALRTGYATGNLAPTAVIDAVLRRISARGDDSAGGALAAGAGAGAATAAPGKGTGAFRGQPPRASIDSLHRTRPALRRLDADGRSEPPEPR